MSVIVLLIVAGGLVAAGFLCAFVWAVRSGQFDDTCTPAVRVLLDEGVPESTGPRSPLSTSATNQAARGVTPAATREGGTDVCVEHR
jgi:cbb3-type cytochrome oxidase maturation protein